MKRKNNSLKIKSDLVKGNISISHSFLIFLMIMFVLSIASHYIGFKEISKILSFISLTLIGIFLLTIYIQFIKNVRKEDFNYFRSIISGIFGGLVVYTLLQINLKYSGDFWLYLNEILSKIVMVLGIILLGYLLSKKK